MVEIPLPFSSHHKSPADKAAWRASVERLLGRLRKPDSFLIAIEIELHAPWFDGDWHLDPKQPDWDRLVTPLQDAVCAAIGINDRHVFRAEVTKVDDTREYARVSVRAWNG